MRNIKGYVCLMDFENATVYHGKCMHVERYSVLYGKSIHHKDYIFENWQTNGLKPYDTLKDAKQCSALMKRGHHNTTLAKVQMRIAEKGNLREIKQLDEKSLVVIMIDNSLLPWIEMKLIGEVVGGMPSEYPLPYALMGSTRFKKTIDTLESAMHIAEEVVRQTKFPTQIAEFYLKELV